MSNKKICIFTGSGFSKVFFNQKIQDDFIHDFLNSAESESYNKYLSKDLKAHLINIGDIELVMSHYHNSAYSNLKKYNRNSFKQYKRDILFLRTAVSIYFREKFKNIKKPNIDLRNFFLKNNIDKESIFIVTTNYDLGIEKIIDDIFGINNYYYPGISDKQGKIPILKLHGSINWMEERGNVSDIYFNRKNNSKIYLNKLEELFLIPINKTVEFKKGFCLIDSNKIKYTPVLIPFFLQKEYWMKENNKDWEKIYFEIWDKTFSYLTNSEKIYFFGYGLPSADHYIYSFLYSILKEKVNDIICHAVDIREDTVLLKMLKHLYGSNSNKLNLFTGGLEQYFI